MSASIQGALAAAWHAREAGHGSDGARHGASAAELARWLLDPAAPAPSLEDLAVAFGLHLRAPQGASPSALPRRLHFALAVLRDTFPDDAAVRRWLRRPAAFLGGERPLDALLHGRIDRLEAVAVRAWNGEGGASAAVRGDREVPIDSHGLQDSVRAGGASRSPASTTLSEE